MGIAVLDIVSAITTTTTQNAVVGLNGAAANMYLILDVTAIGAGSGWTINADYVTPGGNKMDVGAAAVATTTGASSIVLSDDFVAATTSRNVVAIPIPNQIVYARTTEGTTPSLTATIYLVTPD